MLNTFKVRIGVILLSSLPIQAFAESIPSAKMAVRVGDVKIVNAKNVNYATVASALIKGSSPADLIIDVSMICGLMTSTTVRTKDGISDTSSASAAVYGRILVDGKLADPGEVPICKRTQELTATLQGIITKCSDSNGDGTLDMLTECTTIDEEIGLMQDTAGAHAFTWAVQNVGSGVHKIELQVKVDSNGAVQKGSYNAWASVGKASIKVQKANLKGNELLF